MRIFNQNIYASSFEVSLNLYDWQMTKFTHSEEMFLTCKCHVLSHYFDQFPLQLPSFSYSNQTVTFLFC